MENLSYLLERYSYYGRSLVLGGSLFALLCASLVVDAASHQHPPLRLKPSAS